MWAAFAEAEVIHPSQQTKSEHDRTEGQAWASMNSNIHRVEGWGKGWRGSGLNDSFYTTHPSTQERWDLSIDRWSHKALLEHWSQSPKEPSLCEVNVQRLSASSPKDVARHLQLPTLTTAASCKDQNTYRGLVSLLHDQQSCSPLLSSFSEK